MGESGFKKKQKGPCNAGQAAVLQREREPLVGSPHACQLQTLSTPRHGCWLNGCPVNSLRGLLCPKGKIGILLRLRALLHVPPQRPHCFPLVP